MTTVLAVGQVRLGQLHSAMGVPTHDELRYRTGQVQSYRALGFHILGEVPLKFLHTEKTPVWRAIKQTPEDRGDVRGRSKVFVN